MKNLNRKITLGFVLACSFSSLAQAEGFYVSAQLGASIQANDSEPYGDNIAADGDFPSSFDAGDGMVGSLGLGYAFTEHFRVEGRLGYHESEFNDTKEGVGARLGEEYTLNGEITSTTLTVEGFYDFVNKSSFTPYLKAGIGISDNSYSARLGGAGVAAFDAFDGTQDGYYDNYSDGSSTEFAWNVGAGVDVQIFEGISLYGEYQYMSFGDVETGQDAFTDGFRIDDVSAHELMAGIRVQL